jgi:hypothetical protein
MTVGGDARVCPHCGEPPGEGVFCAACGRNLAAVDRLPTRAEWEIAGTQDDRPLADRCAEATAAFLAAMHAAGARPPEALGELLRQAWEGRLAA